MEQDQTRYTIRMTVFIAAVLLMTSACADTGPLGPATGESARPAASVVATDGEGAVIAVPYRGTLRTTAQVPATSPAGCETFANTAQEGQATLLGTFVGTGTTCNYDGQVGVTNPPINPGGGPPPYFVTDFDVEQTHVTTNGDELHITGTGVFVVSMANGAAGFEGSGSIAGGTGRFEGATGTFDIEGVAGLPAHFEGTAVLDTSTRSD